MKIFRLSVANRRFKERSDWHIFSAVSSRHNAGFLAFHEVKCISEHLTGILLFLILPLYFISRCTHFAQFFGHSMTKGNWCVIVSGNKRGS